MERGFESSDLLAWRAIFTGWLQAFRIFSLTASITPLLLGTAMAWSDGFVSLGRSVLALFGSVAIHVGTNLINDYYDHVNGVDCIGSTGSSKVIQEGLLTPSEVWWGGIMSFSAGALAGLILAGLCGWPILAIGVASVAAGYFYTAWPLALGYVALGELTVFIFMGPVIVVGAYYVAALRFAWQPLIASLPIGFLVAAILHANNLRDIDFDLINHKFTLANLFGRQAANWELGVLYAGAYAALLIAVVLEALPWTALIAFLTVGLARSNIRLAVKGNAPERLDSVVLGSAGLHMQCGLFLIAGIIIGHMI
jgi:1,4-dihydroxy-2-naphthoate octaprenyltransferase